MSRREVRIIDPDESDEEQEEVAAAPVRSRGRPSRANTSRRETRIIDPDEEDEEEEEVAPARSRGRQSRANSSRAVHRRIARVIETIDEEEEDEEQPQQQERPASRGRRRRATEDNEATERTSKHKESLSDATLAVLAFSGGPIKEADLKPLLVRGRFKDWEDGLAELNQTLSDGFGLTLVYDGIAKQFFVRNDLKDIKAQLSTMFTYGALNTVRVDDGTITAAEAPPMTDEAEFSDKDKKGFLFTVLSTIMMANNVQLGHKQWAVEEEVLKNMCCEDLDVPTAVFEKLLSTKNAEFVKDGWIRRSVQESGDGNFIAHYFWGYRAIATISTLKLFEKFCLVNDNNKLEWGNYEEILKTLDQKNDLYHERIQQ